MEKLCVLCNKKVNDVSAIPGDWGIKIPYMGGEGQIRIVHMHMSCAAKIINETIARNLQGDK